MVWCKHTIRVCVVRFGPLWQDWLIADERRTVDWVEIKIKDYGSSRLKLLSKNTTTCPSKNNMYHQIRVAKCLETFFSIRSFSNLTYTHICSHSFISNNASYQLFCSTLIFIFLTNFSSFSSFFKTNVFYYSLGLCFRKLKKNITY